MMMGGGGHGQVSVPPGFRFHPTDEELLYYYLRKKVSYESIDLDVIREVDLNKLEPWDLKEKCRIGSGGQNEWYFFSHKDKKYPTGSRTNRATTAGFWKATGRDKAIHLSSTECGSGSSKRIGMRKTLVFYTGRAPHGQKTDWIMHEYRLDDHEDPHPDFNINNYTSSSSSTALPEVQEDGWVVCRVFKKKNQNRSSSSSSSSLVQLQPEDEGEDHHHHHHDHMNKLMLLQQGSHDHHVDPKRDGAAAQQLQAADPHNYQLIHTAAGTGSGTSSMFDHHHHHHHGSSCMHLPQLLSSPHDHDHHIPTSSLLSSSSSDLAAALDQHTSTNCGCTGPGGLLLQQPQDHHHNNPSSAADWSFLDKLLASHSHQQQHSQLGLLLAAEHSAPPPHQTKFNHHHHHQLLIHPSSSSQSHPTPPPHDHSSSHLFSFHYLNGHEN